MTYPIKHTHVPASAIHTTAVTHPPDPSRNFHSHTQVQFVPQPHLAEFGERLVCLAHGRSGLRSGLSVQVRVPEPAPAVAGLSAAAPEQVSHMLDVPCELPPGAESAPTGAVLDFIASSETLDRSDEIIVATGWQLDNYRRNPVFQNAHQYGDVIFTLGRALITEIRPGPDGAPVLFQRIEFAVDANPMARIAYGLYKGKFLNAVSVGFIPLRWETGAPDAGYRRKYIEQELLEVSAVAIPANPDALRLGLKSGAIHAADIRELADLCTRELSTYGGSSHELSTLNSQHSTFSELATALREFLRRI